MWSIDSTNILLPLSKYQFSDAKIRSAAFSPDGNKIVAVTDKSKVFLLDANQIDTIWTLERAWDELDFHQIDLLNTLGKETKEYIKPEVISASFSTDGSRVLTFARYMFDDPFVKVWNVENGEELYSLKGLKGMTYSADFYGDHITTTSAWISLEADGDSILYEPEIITWGARPWHESRLLIADQKIKSIGFLSDSYGVIGRSDRPAVLDLQSGAMVPGWEVQQEMAGSGRVSIQLAAYDDQENLLLWQFSDQQKMISKTMGDHEGRLQLLTVSPDGKQVAGGKEGSLYLFSTESLDEPLTVEAHNGEITAIAYSPDGQTVYTASDNGQVKVWDALSGKSIIGWLAHAGDQVNTIAISPDGKQAATGSNKGVATLWNLSNKQAIFSWNQKENGFNPFAGYAIAESFQPQDKDIDEMNVEVNDIRFSDDSLRILIATFDDDMNTGLIRVWDIRTKTPLFTLSGNNTFQQVEFSPKGSHILSYDSKGNLEIWTNPIGSLQNGKIYNLTPEEREKYGVPMKEKR